MALAHCSACGGPMPVDEYGLCRICDKPLQGRALEPLTSNQPLDRNSPSAYLVTREMLWAEVERLTASNEERLRRNRLIQEQNDRLRAALRGAVAYITMDSEHPPMLEDWRKLALAGAAEMSPVDSKTGAEVNRAADETTSCP